MEFNTINSNTSTDYGSFNGFSDFDLSRDCHDENNGILYDVIISDLVDCVSIKFYRKNTQEE